MRKLFALIMISAYSIPTHAQGYWSQVPAAPTGCYSEKDDFTKKLDASRELLKKATTEKEDAMRKQAENMTQEQKMKIATQYQSMSPDEIRKMQSEQSELATIQQATGTKGSEVETRFNELESAYNDDIKSKLGPVTAEAAKLPDGEGTPDWAIQKGKELMLKYNAEYEAICAKYFTGNGALFAAWLADYKKYLTETEVPFTHRSVEIQYKILGITPDPDLPEMEAVAKYMDRMRTVYGMRHSLPQGE